MTTSRSARPTNQTPRSGSGSKQHPVDVLVIGGGLAGLTAAIEAARSGASTMLIDAGHLGGRARSKQHETANGVATLNDGPHALYNSGAGAEVLAELGVIYRGGEPPIGSAKILWDGHNQQLPADALSLLRSPILGTRAKLQAAALFANPGRAARRAATTPDMSLGEWFNQHRTTSEVRRLVSMLVRLSTYDANPEALPAAAAFAQLALANDGVTYLDDGWQSLVDQLRQLAVRHKVSIVTQSSVKALETFEDGWTATVSGRESTRSILARRLVLATGTPQAARRLLQDSLEVRLPDADPPPLNVACLDVLTTQTARVPILLSVDNALYFSEHSPVADLTPTGTRLYCVLKYLDTDEHHSPDDTKRSLQDHAGLAGVDTSDAIDCRYLHSMTAAGAAHRAGIERLQGDEMTTVGIELAGDWVGPNMLADAALESGAKAGRRAAESVRSQDQSAQAGWAQAGGAQVARNEQPLTIGT